MKKILMLALPILIIASAAMLMFFNLMLKPLLASIAEAKVRNIATKAMNQAILDNFNADVTYKSLMTVVQDKDGRIAMLQANSTMMNRLASQTALSAQKNISNIDVQEVGIPVGTVIGGQLFSGRGPLIKLSVYPVGSVLTTFISKFEEAGINQTLHRINLRLAATVRVIIPGGGVTVQVVLESPVAESIIVGIVPTTYVNVPKEDVLNLVPID